MFCAATRVSNKPYDVTRRLLSPLEEQGYHLFIDNYYCEPKLCQDLADVGMMVCGTVRKNRITMPKELGLGRLQQGTIDFRRKRDVVVCRWADKKEVLTCSTMHKPVLQLVQCHFERKEKPVAVTAYTSNMLGVDRSDQLLSYFPIHRRSMKWWKKPFFHLFTLCMIQTHILLNKYRTGLGMKKLTLEDTVKSICTELPLTHVAEPERADDGPARPLRRIMPKDTHFMRVIPTLPGQRQRYRNCKVAMTGVSRTKKIRGRTSGSRFSTNVLPVRSPSV